mgnify:CR=1 FL=1
MTEFWLWVTVVTLIIIAILAMSFLMMHLSVQLKKADILIDRIERQEKLRGEKLRFETVEQNK